MERRAVADYPVHDLIARRWSPSWFAKTAIEPEKILSVLEAARWSASSFNEQPWRYILATADDTDHYARVLSCLMDKNQQWAKGAPVLILTFAKRTFSRNNNPNRVAMYDLGAASAQLTFQATHLGLFLHQMAGIDQQKIREMFHVPEDFEPATGIALGYPPDPGSLTQEQKEKLAVPRPRKPLRALVFDGAWNETHPLLTR